MLALASTLQPSNWYCGINIGNKVSDKNRLIVLCEGCITLFEFEHSKSNYASNSIELREREKSFV